MTPPQLPKSSTVFRANGHDVCGSASWETWRTPSGALLEERRWYAYASYRNDRERLRQRIITEAYDTREALEHALSTQHPTEEER